MSRQKKQTYIARQPEHQSRNLNVPVAGKSFLHDNFGMPKLNKNQVQKAPVQRQITNEPVKIKADNNPGSGVTFYSGEKRSAQAPSQPMVSVGMNEESMWFEEGKVAVPANMDYPMQDQINNNELVDVEKLQNFDNLNMQYSGDIPPQQEYEEPVQEQSSDDNIDLNPGQYVIIFDGDVVVRDYDFNRIKSVVEEMILKYNIDVEQITLIKRLPINFGLHIEES